MTVYIRCSVAMLFTCTLVLSCPAGKGGFECETWVVEVTARYWVGQNIQEGYLWKRASKRFSIILDWGHAGRIREVLQEMAVQVCTKLWLHNYTMERNCHELFIACYLCLIIVIPCLQADLQYWPMFIFHRLKINHDPHEFILKFGTIANIIFSLKLLLRLWNQQWNSALLCYLLWLLY